MRITILLVEDNPGDVLLMQEALDESRIMNTLYHVNDGIEAWAYLTKVAAYDGAITPDLILLDLNLPRMDGRELLRKIKQEPTLKRIPVIIMTTSADDEDILQSYELYANAYITKPADQIKFGEMVDAIDAFWFSIAQLPPHID